MHNWMITFLIFLFACGLVVFLLYCGLKFIQYTIAGKAAFMAQKRLFDTQQRNEEILRVYRDKLADEVINIPVDGDREIKKIFN